MRDITGGTLFEIRPATPYNQDYDTAERQGRKETRDGYCPPLAEQAGLSACDTILLGTPNWANLQHSSIVAVKKPERRRKFAALCGEQGHIAQAPVFLVFCADFYRSPYDHYPEVLEMLRRKGFADKA